MKGAFKRSVLYSISLFFISSGLSAAIPAGYYDKSDGKSGEELKTVIHQTVRNSITLDFDNFTAAYWGDNYFKRTDWNSAGYYWDMYSSEQRSVYNSGQMAREHCMPRSWWGTISNYGDANSDINNLFPADTYANSKKSNLPMGICDSFAWNNGVVKVGSNIYTGGYEGTVFEPADEYKGDFARTYFYMVTCYEDYSEQWKDDGIKTMLKNDSYPVFQDWAIEMLLEWCRQDPVSQKEKDRNDSVFVLQQNRNPFIDIPELEEYIWGNKTNEPLSISDKVTSPSIVTPSNDASINYGDVLTGRTRNRYLPLKGHLFTNPVEIDFLENTSGFFSVENSVTADLVNQTNGYFLQVAYSPTAQGSHAAKMRISSDEIAEPIIVQLKGNAVYSMSVSPVEPDDNMDVMIFYTGPWEKAELPGEFTTNAAGAPYANGDFSFRANGEYLIVEFDEVPDVLQFAIYPRNVWGSNNNHLYVYEGTDKSSFGDPIADFDNAFVVNNTYNNTPQIKLSEDTRAIKIEYIKQAQNVGITNIILTRKKEDTSRHEEQINKLSVLSLDGYIYIQNLCVNDIVSVYNILGNLIMQQKTSKDYLVVPVSQPGVYILRVNNETVKFIVQ